MSALIEFGIALLTAIVLIPFAIFLALVYKGIDRKLAARLQSRVGPPIRQPFRDVSKFMMKETVTPDDAVPWIFHSMPLIALVGSLILLLYIPLGPFQPIMGEYGDLILVIYLLAIPSLAMSVGGFSSGSPVATIGAQREMVLLMSYEFPLAVIALSLAWIMYSDFPASNAFAMAMYIQHPVWDGVGTLGIFGLILLLSSFLVIIPSELSKLPFDIPEAETELGGGVFVEYSGRDMGMFYLSDAVKGFVMASLLIALFIPYNISPWIAHTFGVSFPVINGIAIGALVIDFIFYLFKVFLVMFFSITFVRVAMARLKINMASYIYLVPVTIVSFIGMLLVYLDTTGVMA